MLVAAVGEHEEAARLKAPLTDPEVQVSTHLDDTTKVPEDGAGILAGTTALSDARSQLAAAIGAAVDATDPTFAVLAQIGITLQGLGQVSDPTLANTLEIDETKLDEALLKLRASWAQIADGAPGGGGSTPPAGARPAEAGTALTI